MLAAIAPYYDFMDANLKPWHLKVDYELYDEKGNPAEQGVFEYWWASPKVYRSSWTAKDAAHSEWHTSGGKSFTLTTGNPLSVYEYWLQPALLSPLPGPDELAPGRTTLVEHNLGSGAQVRCISAVPSSINEQDARMLPVDLYSEYCVNKMLPILLGYYRIGGVLIKCLNFTQMQGKSMPRTVLMINGSRQVLSARLEATNTISQDDPALAPPPDATSVDSRKVQIGTAAGSALILEKTKPVVADSVKVPNTPSKVVLEATIGTDGGLQDVRLVSAQTPALVLPAFLSIAQWRFRPYRVVGKPAIAEMQVEVDFPPSQHGNAPEASMSVPKTTTPSQPNE